MTNNIDYLTIYEAAEIAKITPDYMRRLVRDKEHGFRGVDATKIKGQWYIRRTDLEAFLQSERVAAEES